MDSHLLNERAAFRIETVVADKWQLESLIGIGGMASVYAARHRNGKQVAIKILHPELCLHGEALVRFVREGYLANLVEHPGVVSVLDDGVLPDGAPYIVMEYLEGESLEARCERLGGPVALPDALSIAAGILSVLEVAHGAGIVHRDIKPDNVFVTLDGRVKVLDFGIARLAELSGTGASATVTGRVLGTPTYMPPEQAGGHKEMIDHRSDIWAVGATLFKALSGAFVHPAITMSMMLVAAMTHPARSVAVVAPSLPRPIVDVIDRALQFDAADRFQTAAEMATALRDAAFQCGIQIPLRPSFAGFTPPPRRPRSSFPTVPASHTSAAPAAAVAHSTPAPTASAPLTLAPVTSTPAAFAPVPSTPINSAPITSTTHTSVSFSLAATTLGEGADIPSERIAEAALTPPMRSVPQNGIVMGLLTIATAIGLTLSFSATGRVQSASASNAAPESAAWSSSTDVSTPVTPVTPAASASPSLETTATAANSVSTPAPESKKPVASSKDKSSSRSAASKSHAAKDLGSSRE